MQDAQFILKTERLVLRKMSFDDAPFILELLNDPAFLRNIGDKSVRTLEDAKNYILTGPMASYENFGFGLYLTELRESGVPVGICGLVKRETLEHADVGFAFMPQYCGKGFATESAAAVLKLGKTKFRLERIVAIVSPDNEASINVLQKLGMCFEEMIQMSPNAEPCALYGPSPAS